jgi:hypothetical protein
MTRKWRITYSWSLWYGPSFAIINPNGAYMGTRSSIPLAMARIKNLYWLYEKTERQP